MSKLKENQFIKCTFCFELMFDILICERVRSHGAGRCLSIVCHDCRLCGCCQDDLNDTIKNLKRLKHKPNAAAQRQCDKEILKNEFNIDVDE